VRELSGRTNVDLIANTDIDFQVRFNVLRVLPRTGKAVKKFNKF
jgi:hypothetical protein